jgi:hypothetical protein
MKAETIFQPMLALMGLTLVVWVYMYARRIPFITRNRLTPNQLTAAELARLSPPAVSNPSDNLKNLFELPTLFYALLLYLYVVGQVDGLYSTLAWAFVGFRVLHSAVHCTVNIILLRFTLYAISAAALWGMVLRAAWGAFG